MNHYRWRVRLIAFINELSFRLCFFYLGLEKIFKVYIGFVRLGSVQMVALSIMRLWMLNARLPNVTCRHRLILALNIGLVELFPGYQLRVVIALILRCPKMLDVIRFHQRLTLATCFQKASLLVWTRLFFGALFSGLSCAKRLLLRRCNYSLLLRTQWYIYLSNLLYLVLSLQVNYLARYFFVLKDFWLLWNFFDWTLLVLTFFLQVKFAHF